MPAVSLCPPTTKITDYAYPESHPLRLTNYPSRSRDSLLSEQEFSFPDSHDDSVSHAYSSDEINRRAVALFDFHPENDNEVALTEGQVIWISYRHGQGWLVAEDPNTGENGLVPEEYVEIIYGEEIEDLPRQFMPRILQNFHDGNDSEWEDTEDEEDIVNENQTIPQLVKQMEASKIE